MHQKLTNRLNMVRACLNVAESPEYKSVWTSGPPVDFRTEIEQVAAQFEAVTTKGGLADAATGGGSDAKAAARLELENSTLVLARALALHFLRTGDLDRRGKVDLTRSGIQSQRAQGLANQATVIRDLANAVVAEPGAENRGISAQLVEEHEAAIARFSIAAGTPRGQIAKRSALLREVRSGVEAIVNRLHALDDLILQYGRAAIGRSFIAAWRAARVIVDSGGSGVTPTQGSTPATQHPSATLATSTVQAPSAVAPRSTAVV